MRRWILASVSFATLSSAAIAQHGPAPMERPASGAGQNGEDAMTDVDPEVLARCKREASRRKLSGSDREAFIGACVEAED